MSFATPEDPGAVTGLQPGVELRAIMSRTVKVIVTTIVLSILSLSWVWVDMRPPFALDTEAGARYATIFRIAVVDLVRAPHSSSGDAD